MVEPASVRVCLEIGTKRVFASALDWPGWARSGRDEADALDALLAAADRYRAVADAAGLVLPPPDRGDLVVIERVPGSATTDFGAPGAVAEADREPTEAPAAERLAALVSAAWDRLDAVVAAAPEELRKGPRGGGRDTSGIVAHAVEADHVYAREIGLRLPAPDPTDREAVTTLRAAVLEVLGARSDGSPLAGRRWPARYAARRISWHALDHAWEIEDRSGPG